MTSKSCENCVKIREAFEGREALYLEGGVLRVRVSGIRCNADERTLDVMVEEIPTPGLEQSLLRVHFPGVPAPLRWGIGAGCTAAFSENSLAMGYGGWSLHFGTELLQGFVALAAGWPAELDEVQRYQSALEFLDDYRAQGGSRPVFEK